jgi:hypothetical protein
MKRSNPTPLLGLGMLGLVLGFLIEISATSSGLSIILPPLTMPLTLVAIGVIVVLLAWPIRQSTKGKRNRRVDPFVAMRVAVLAKASSLSGALLLGLGIGLVLYILTRSVLPAVSSLWLAIGMALGAAVLLAGGLLAEHFCTLPPDDDQKERGEVSA